MIVLALLIVALVLFVLAALGISAGKVAPGWAGLAVLTAAQLWPLLAKSGGG